MLLRISNQSNVYSDEIKQKKINIAGVEGIYIPNNDGKVTVTWMDSGLNYEITYFPKVTRKEISKRQLIKMAESFG
ncbi:DUF4367 domain-containing protein [Aquibacillus rhizosphaerae]|uniref:DUF4367 domain-containing protein n=1 Tax=Aquibacillus rhizosphaerae TaxID=3051431 RepID=A0ABT7LAR5_9BACI|nr:DUF4367 domain-containing protein [Aquibacillus sp. LR5S19]MDL4842964.1 DUF4367 domain-containing protein [Aquibacillus sp. LR5S19]